MSNHKKKQSRKGNNPHGNVGTYKCSRCREFKAKCLFTQSDRPCKRCALAGKTCGPKTLARENEHHPHKKPLPPTAEHSRPPKQHASGTTGSNTSAAWALDKPLLPRILEMVGTGPEHVGEVARKLAAELAILHGKVVENAAVFRAPKEFEGERAREAGGMSNGLDGQGQMNHQPGGGQRGIRAVSLPPVLPDHNLVVEENHTEPMMQVEKPKQVPDDSRRTDRDPGSGLPQYQPYCTQCAFDQGIRTQDASPASHTHFNQHPKAVCRMYHSDAVKWRVGCSLHRGALDEMGKCAWCQQETQMGGIIWSRSLRQTMGYPGDEHL